MSGHVHAEWVCLLPQTSRSLGNPSESASTGCMCLSRHALVPLLGVSALPGLASCVVFKVQSLFDAVLRSLRGAQACAGAAAFSSQQRAGPLTPCRPPPA